jgi:hypothetical protein
VKKILVLLSSLFLATTILHAQDDELPPPSSNPKSDSIVRKEQNLPKAEDFQGFKPKKKVDWSKFIIEPNFNLSIAQGSVDLGLSPYVGYKVFEPEKSKENGNNTGLFVGGGVTYRFTQVTVQTDPIFGQVYRGRGKFHTYGGGVFLQYNIWRGFFARSRFELLHRSGDDLFQGTVNIIPRNGGYDMSFPKLNKTIPALLLGVGYNLLRSKNFFMPVMISYDVLHSIVDKQYSLYPRGLVVQLGFVTLF